MYVTLQSGSRGDLVRELQLILNHRLLPSPRLTPDGIFGPQTRNAVLRFQEGSWLSKDGVVGRCTWNALKDMEQYAISYPVQLVPQHTTATCWSAATAMLLGRQVSVAPGAAGIDPNPGPGFGGLWNDSASNNPNNTQAFARSHGLRMEHGRSWTPAGLASMMQAHGPVMADLLWNDRTYAAGAGSPGHMLVFGGIRGDNTSEGTTLRIYDPWPVGRGSVYSVVYGPFMRTIPTATYQIFYR
jgi:hypothetical protein